MSRKINKIALINPSTHSDAEGHIYEMYKRNIDNYKPYITPPLNLLTLAAFVPCDVEVKIIDEHVDSIDFDEHFDLVGLTAMTQQANRAYQIANKFRNGNTIIVMGGIHASVLPDEALDYVDTVFVGEAEETWPIFLEDLKNGSEKKIYKSDSPFDLNNAIIPRYELINYEKIHKLTTHFKFLPIQATRGCPHDCSFCVTTKFYGKKIRKKRIGQIVAEVKELKKHNENALFLFVDDNLFVDRKFSKELLKELMPLKISYNAQTDIKVADDPELLELAYKSGCVQMIIGFESIDPGSLGEINNNNWKLKQLETYAGNIKKIQEKGIMVWGSFVIGFENDSLSTFENVRDFVVENHIAGHFTLLTPLPGSVLYQKCQKDGQLYKDVYWDHFSFYKLNIKHKNIEHKLAEEKIVWLFDQVYRNEVALKRTRQMMQYFKQLDRRWN